MDATRPPRTRRIGRLVRPFQRFADLESSGGILLIVCTVIALAWANSPRASVYFHLWHTSFRLAGVSQPLHFWINDGLMAIFFLAVGLEIKRETIAGELATFRRAALPMAGAIGGMLVPAIIYAFFNSTGPGKSGWGIPMATDIAFALGILSLLGNRVPPSLRIFLAALAIADDIGAVLVIAFYYTDKISTISLGVAAILFVLLVALNRAGARHLLFYIVPGIGLWLAFLKSGVHPTVAGVLLAMTIPARQGGRSHASRARKQVRSPMLRLEHALVPWVSYFIMPLFALANAGVALGAEARGSLLNPISLGVISGLVLGKPIGIMAFAWLASRARLASLPEAISWRQILGAGALGGIGFTMSLFVANLAFGPTPILETAKVGVLAASVVSAIAGTLILSRARRKVGEACL